MAIIQKTNIHGFIRKNILEVLKDSSKLNPEVRKYLEENNKYTEYHLKDTKELQKKLFAEIKGRIKLDDESLSFTDKKYIYWTKTTKETNYSIKLRKKIGTKKIEEYWNGEEERKKLNVDYFGVGDLEVSNNDAMLAYSLDLKGSEYFTIYIRRILDNKIVSEEIKETSGSITWSARLGYRLWLGRNGLRNSKTKSMRSYRNLFKQKPNRVLQKKSKRIKTGQSSKF